jgi:hypothetical protein
MHDSSRSPCALASHLHDADVLLTPHGFQSMLLMFLPPTAVLFEVSLYSGITVGWPKELFVNCVHQVFPYKYFKTGYARFGTEYGITYNSVMSPPTNWHTRLLLALVNTNTCMDYKQCRTYARGADVMYVFLISLTSVVRGIPLIACVFMLQIHRECHFDVEGNGEQLLERQE